MPPKSFAELEKISRKQSETIKQQNEILNNQRAQLKGQEQSLEMQRMAFEQGKFADTRHQVNQCVDFAIRSLPWWKRSTKNVVNLASEYLLTIKHETAKHVSLANLAMASIMEETKKDEPKEAVARDLHQPEPKEEGAELEIQ